jgi:hypothetical protein
MTWIWRQTQGDLLDGSGKIIATGYSGALGFENNPVSQDIHDRGPIPQGSYAIGPPSDTTSHGPYVLPLEPAPENEMYGRSGFLIHGDSKEHPGQSSEGCIILPRAIREIVWNSGDHELHVISGIESGIDEAEFG